MLEVLLIIAALRLSMIVLASNRTPPPPLRCNAGDTAIVVKLDEISLYSDRACCTALGTGEQAAFAIEVDTAGLNINSLCIDFRTIGEGHSAKLGKPVDEKARGVTWRIDPHLTR